MSDSENLDIECLILIFFFSDVTNQAIILAFEELKRRIIFLKIKFPHFFVRVAKCDENHLDQSGSQYEPLQRIRTKRTQTDTQHNINPQIEYVII